MVDFIVFRIRESLAFAYIQGAYEAWKYGTSGGRTHMVNPDWNEAYDRGMNLGERLSFARSQSND